MTIRVILCTHNGVRFLEAQLASIMDQNRPVDVVHIFDFGSSDGTQALLAELASRWSVLDVRIVNRAPGVIQSFFHAFLEIVPQCGDDDILFLSDQDDVWLPGKTERMIARLTTARLSGSQRLLAFHDVVICDEALQPIRHGFYKEGPFRLPRDLGRENLLIANPVIGHTIAVTKPMLELALRCIRPSRYVMHDWALVLFAAHTGEIVYVPERLGLYRQHGANILGAGGRRSLVGYIRRAIELSRIVHIQAAAFIDDSRYAARLAGISNPYPVLPGRGPVAWRLGMTMARHGPSTWHRLMAMLQILHLLRCRTATSLPYNAASLVLGTGAVGSDGPDQRTSQASATRAGRSERRN